MNDPSKVLGISREATDEEVKKAYRDMARKYHPDNYVNSPMSDLAEEKMKEINRAYEEIQKSRTNPKRSNDTGYEGSYDARSTFDQIRRLINSGLIDRADTMLDIFALSDRGAEWNFLKGCVLLKKGFYYDAQKYFETACYLDPQNAEYRQALNSIRYARANHTERTTAASTPGTSGCLSCCGQLLCLNCLCRFFGGDRFRCI